jgi:hypothetical protein
VDFIFQATKYQKIRGVGSGEQAGLFCDYALALKSGERNGRERQINQLETQRHNFQHVKHWMTDDKLIYHSLTVHSSHKKKIATLEL